METHVRHILGCGLAGSLFLAMAGWSLQTWPQTSAEQTAATLEQQGKTVEAEEAWKAVSKAQPANPLAFAHLGLLEARQEHYAQAIAFYRKAMALNPDLPGLHLNLGLAYFKNGEYKRRSRSSLRCSRHNHRFSREVPSHCAAGDVHYGLGEFSAAVPFLKQASSGDPQNLNLLLTLAHSCLLSNQFPCVLDAFHQLVALNANSAEADMLVGEALDEMKDPVGATREFRAAVEAIRKSQTPTLARLPLVDARTDSGGGATVSGRTR